MMTTLEGFEPVFGSAQLESSSSSSSAAAASVDADPMFLFCLQPKGDDHLEVYVTDFHANTWYCDMSTEFLEDKRDEVGIGGSFEDFIAYVRAAFGSENVKMVLYGPASGAVSKGAVRASVVGQKAKGTPKIWVKLTRLEGVAANDAMSTVSVGIFKNLQKQSVSLCTEIRAHTRPLIHSPRLWCVTGLTEATNAAQLSTALCQEKARADRLQDQLDAMSISGKKKRRSTLSFADPSSLTQTLTTQSQLPSQLVTPSLFATEQNTQGDTSAGATKKGPAGPRIRAAPSIRRPNRRGAVIAAEDANEE